MTQSVFAKHIGVTRQAVSKMKKEGILVIENKQIDVEKTMEYLEKLGRLEHGQKKDREIKEPTSGDYADLRNQYLLERIKKARLENKEKEGSLIEVEEAKRLIGMLMSPVITQMDSLPYTFKTIFPNASDSMIDYLDDYINNIKIESQKDVLKG